MPHENKMVRASAALAMILVFVYGVHFSAAASMKKDLSRATVNKTLVLVDTLKHDLRKNNDDYKDAGARLHNPYLSGTTLPSDLDATQQGNALGPVRRSGDDPPRARPASAPNGTAASGGATKAAPAPVPVPALRRKFSKLHQLLDQEGLLQKFLAGLPEAGKRKHIDWEKPEMGAGEHRPRAFDSNEYFRPTPETIPEAELDMLAATGEHIATLKRRGRLCYRHMLFPEGPKYDSRGKAYVPAHALSVDFAATRRPKLLLPRCCNCCQKSVLGCE